MQTRSALQLELDKLVHTCVETGLRLACFICAFIPVLQAFVAVQKSAELLW